MARRKRFTVYVEVVVRTEIEVLAETMPEALERAKEYEVTDIVDFDTPHNDSEIKVTGVLE